MILQSLEECSTRFESALGLLSFSSLLSFVPSLPWASFVPLLRVDVSVDEDDFRLSVT